ncbi:MAG: DUF5662 family protein [Oscillospiraceae bacterium]|nr:DUF5662 family protein [Oscillospiraceae bacterium]
MHVLKHFKTITAHKWLVMKHCFRVGLYRQGLLHDLSKYSPSEFWVGAKYYQGNRSPNDAERAAKGCSGAWLHHKGRNKHHLEYWIDYSAGGEHALSGMKMPVRYVAEMFCDRVAASKIYQGENYRSIHPYEYYTAARDHYLLHPESRALLEKLLVMLKDEGEEKTFAFLKETLKKEKRLEKGRN